MALPDTGIITRWLYERLRQLTLGHHGRDGRGEEVRHKGLVITVCILASLLLWFTFAMRETYTRTLDFPIEIQNLASDQALSETPPSVMHAQVVGEGIQLLRLYYNPPVIPVDGSSALIDLEVVAPEVVQGVRMEAITPRSVTLYRERRETRRLPIFVTSRIEVESGHHLVGDMSVEPDSVEVSGAASIVRRLVSWPTRADVVAAAADTLDAMVLLSDTLTGLVTLETDRVRLRASVDEFTQGSRLVEVRVTGAQPGQRVSLEPSTVLVTYQVPLADFQDVSTTPDLYAFVPYESIRTDTTGSVRPELHVPMGIEVIGVVFDPPTLRYYDVLEFQ